MFVGIVLAIKRQILLHEDILDRDDPSAITKVHYVSQATFICYLKVPETGGELEIWDRSLSTEEYDRLRGNSYGIDRSLLPPPIHTLKPTVGEFTL